MFTESEEWAVIQLSLQEIWLRSKGQMNLWHVQGFSALQVSFYLNFLLQSSQPYNK